MFIIINVWLLYVNKYKHYKKQNELTDAIPYIPGDSSVLHEAEKKTDINVNSVLNALLYELFRQVKNMLRLYP